MLTLQARQSLFHRPDRPTLVFQQLLNRRPFLIERTDVSVLDELALRVFIKPTQWQALSSTDIRPIGIDATRPFAVEERTHAARVRRPLCEQLRILLADPFGLNVEHGQVIDTALTAPAPAMETCPMFIRNPAGLDINRVVQDSQQWE